MKYLILTTMLLLISCTTMQEKSDELRDIAMACNTREEVPVIENGVAKIEDGKPVMRRPEGTCADEWAAWNEAEEQAVNIKNRQIRAKKPICPNGKTAYCDRWCMVDPPRKRTWLCVDSWIFRNIANF